MSNKNDLLVIGAGGHARSAIDVLISSGVYNVIGCIDSKYSEKNKSECLPGIRIIGNDEMLPDFLRRGIQNIFVALGKNSRRKRIFNTICEMGFSPINAIHASAVVSPFATLGKGICVMPGAIIGANAVIGDNCVINTGSAIDHDCFISAHCHIAPGTVISGCVRIGECTQIGVGACVIDGVNIGGNSFIGAGAAVVGDIPDNVMAYGVPAKVVRDMNARKDDLL